jgi:hypothetical protein
MSEPVSVREDGGKGVVGTDVGRTKLPERAGEVGAGRGCRKVTVSTRSSVDGAPVDSAAR